jgi:signal transduction histidine kinase
MAIRAVLASFVGRTARRRGLHVALGGVIALPYVLLVVVFARMFTDPRIADLPVGVLAAVTTAIVLVPPFLPVVRSLEVIVAQSLLAVDLTTPDDDPPLATRLRAVAWYLVHLVVGGAAVMSVLYVAPVAVELVAGQDPDPPFEGVDGARAWGAALVLLVAASCVVAGCGAGLARLAPVLLGPSPAERLAALRAEADRLAAQTRLARELHDSIGHALTITTLQAAAANRRLDTDPEFVRQALHVVEEIGRNASADLDRVIGVLRHDETSSAAPPRSLADLELLLDETRAAGLVIDATIDGNGAAVPLSVSREAYRVVQEGLTNALRHGGSASASLRVTSGAGGVEIHVSNALPEGQPGRGLAGGRGVAGMRERVAMLGGHLIAGPEDGRWYVRAGLPSQRHEGEQ